MSSSKTVLTLGTLAMSLGVSSAAKASSELALTFELPPPPQAAVAPTMAPVEPVTQPQALVSAEVPLPIPPDAGEPPVAGDNARPAGVYGGLEAIAIGSSASVQALLPPPPPVPDYVQAAAAPVVSEPVVDTPDPVDTPLVVEPDRTPVALFIGIPDKPRQSDAIAVAKAEPTVEVTPFKYSFDNFYSLFEGGTESLVARAVGSAEGTRTPEGHRNPAYYGHADPGNGVWNLGTFSYQHGAASPEEADDKQLRRLQTQTEKLRQIALHQGLQLSQEELLNGIDLANQAPLAALDRGGYIDWLKEAHGLGMQGAEAIVWARTRSFIDPDTQRWNAPGLGNNVYSISHDQERRANAISRAIAAFNTQTQMAIAPAPTANVETTIFDLTSEPTLAEQTPASFALSLGDFSTSDDDESATTVANASRPDVENSPVTPAEAAMSESELTALSSPPAGAGFGLLKALGQHQSHTTHESAATEKRGLERLNQTLMKLFARSEAVSSVSTNVADRSVEPATIPVPEAESNLSVPMAPAPPIAVSDSAPTPATLSGGAFAAPRILSPDLSASDDTVGDNLAVPMDDQAAASTASQTAEKMVLPTHDGAEAIAQEETSENEAEPADTLNIEKPPLLTSESTTAPLVDSEMPHEDDLDWRSGTQPTKAPVDETDAEVSKQQTLDSLEQLQQLLRSEAAAVPTRQP